MTLRRRTPLKPSRGTEWPRDVRAQAYALMPRCIGPLVGMPEPCFGGLELDHIHGRGALGMKGDGVLSNAARLCVVHHDEKGLHGSTWRPRLVEFVGQLMAAAGLGGHEAHVDPVNGCEACHAAVRRAASGGA